FGATQGGVQDMGLAREMIADGYVPPPEAFVVEGMFSEHDLPLSGTPCDTLLCLRGAAGIAPDASGASTGWLQVGMSSTIDPDHFQRPSQTIVATVDVSGSMGWDYARYDEDYQTPGVISHHLLHAIVDELGPEDRIAMVTYGSRVQTVLDFTNPTSGEVEEAIDDLDEAGSTNMEAGLETAYDLARDADFGTDEVRVMLFTDVQPNVGATSGTEFEDMASEGAEDGIGLTVFAMGVGMGQEVLVAMSHLRGGNAFSLFTTEDADELMVDSWPWMVSPIAYDLSVSVDPPEGFSVANAYGFPAGGEDEEVVAELEVATVFLSRRKGAMLLELQPPEEGSVEDLSVTGNLSYTTSEGEEVTDTLSAAYDGTPLDERGHWYGQHSVGRTIALALLVDGMHAAATTYVDDQVAAVAILEGVAARFGEDASALGDEDLPVEVELAEDLLQLMRDGAEQKSLYGPY
ncbi:MAG: VWA domain-containing protein, partial [Deltaproteobacteria bacterium]|nr:VWA domain-containing protein [Deltaproteobacteria bacterium]